MSYAYRICPTNRLLIEWRLEQDGASWCFYRACDSPADAKRSAKSSNMSTFDRSQIKEYLGRVENDTAEFIGAEFEVARLVGFISQQADLGEVSPQRASQLLQDAAHLGRLVQIGHRYAKLARSPSPEIRIMVLADERGRT